RCGSAVLLGHRPAHPGTRTRSHCMKLPADVSQADFDAAVEEFRQAVGAEWVFTREEDVALYRDAYSLVWDEENEPVPSGAVAPASTEEVQAVVRIANRYRLPLFPISTGKNLGY